MLSRVEIQNFKSIGEPGVDLELKPLTFLVGPNGGGKSSVLEAIGVAAQGGLTGQSASLPTWEDVKHRGSLEPGIIQAHLAENHVSGVDLRVIFEIAESRSGYSRIPELGDSPTDHEIANAINESVAQEFRPKTFFLSSTRGDVPYGAGTREYPDWVGIHGGQLLSLLARIFGQRSYHEIADTISAWAHRFGVNDLSAGLFAEERIGSDYEDSELKVALNLALSSSGAKQVLTIITQLFWAQDGSLLMIEEPEISLHPKAQIDVLEMFAEAINQKGHQLLTTTHSLFMMQAIGYAVQQEWLSADQVAVYHVEKKPETGTTAKALKLNEKGFIEGWIPSFAQVERKLMREWLKTLPEE